jgi:hypothetical protein
MARAPSQERRGRRIKHTYEAATVRLHLDVVMRVRPFASLHVVYKVSVCLIQTYIQVLLTVLDQAAEK